MDDYYYVLKMACARDNWGVITVLPRIWLGVDWGRKMEVVYREGDFHVVKRPGHKDWAGVGREKYYPTRYFLMEIENNPADEGTYRVKIHKQEETGPRKWNNIRFDFAVEAGRMNILKVSPGSVYKKEQEFGTGEVEP